MRARRSGHSSRRRPHRACRQGAEADRPADMVEHDLRVGKGPRQVHKLSELGMVHPGVEAEAERSETGEALADLGVHQQTFGADHRGSPGRLGGMRGGDEADAVEAAASSLDHRLQYLLDRRAERQIGVTDDAGADPCIAVVAAGAAIVATLLANSISPTGRISTGPAARYIDSHSR